ncbi:MAG: hypothetical protein A3D92_18010 [Bacteroidetes bacterium RIFCSPHIGHO2_02_FULL_44_7]|nr:MAG: hypothetical protein A3D92_18010 [Bacteroidetes bacterium RIFCSPHIGHO2_02_FULL_44_7]
MAFQISTSILINAPREKVWAIFSDFKAYPNWNPFIRSITGDLAVNKKFKAEIGTMKFSPTLKVFETNSELTWQGRLLFPGIFDGKHTFLLLENELGGTTFIQKEEFRGMLVPFLKKKLRTEIVAGFEDMNKKMKELVEQSEGK